MNTPTPPKFLSITTNDVTGSMIRLDRSFRTVSRSLLIVAVVAKVRGVPLGMSRIHPECPDSDPADRSAATDALLRQEPDEEEDEEEDEGDGKEDDDDDDKDDDGYSA
jgi:hypothetical protein